MASVLNRLASWLDEDPDLDEYVSSQLSVDLPWMDEVRDVASGLLAVRIIGVQRRYLLWFRPEIVRTVRWAGEPAKSVAGRRQAAAAALVRGVEGRGAGAE